MCDCHAVSLTSTKCEWLLMEWMHKFESNGFRGGARSLICLSCRRVFPFSLALAPFASETSEPFLLCQWPRCGHRTMLPAAPLWYTCHQHHHRHPDTVDSFAQSCGRQLGTNGLRASNTPALFIHTISSFTSAYVLARFWSWGPSRSVQFKAKSTLTRKLVRLYRNVKNHLLPLPSPPFGSLFCLLIQC